jgi:hypothetical protein
MAVLGCAHCGCRVGRAGVSLYRCARKVSTRRGRIRRQQVG